MVVHFLNFNLQKSFAFPPIFMKEKFAMNVFLVAVFSFQYFVSFTSVLPVTFLLINALTVLQRVSGM